MKQPIARSIERAGYILLLFILTVFGLSGFIKPVSKINANSLHVPLIPQMASEWCWAASTEMISTYYHSTVNSNAPVITQCQEVQQYLGSMCKIDCNALPDTITGTCNWLGTPFAVGLGYTMSDTNIALSWEALSAQISSGKPVVFEWNWTGVTTQTDNNSGGHYLVAEGCPQSSYIAFHGWVSVHDPMPVGIGRHRIMSYAEYRNLPSIDFPGYCDYAFNSHGYDFDNLTYTGN